MAEAPGKRFCVEIYPVAAKYDRYDICSLITYGTTGVDLRIEVPFLNTGARVLERLLRTVMNSIFKADLLRT